MYEYAVVGLGVAGLLVLAHLPATTNVLVLERGMVGGALATDYAHVMANIPSKALAATLRRLPGCASAALPFLDGIGGDECPILSDLVKQLKALIAPRLKQVTYRSTSVTRVEREKEGWRVTGETGSWLAKRAILCTGAAPVTMDLPIPHVPLPIALSPLALSRTLDKGARVVVFGTAHSGTLVLKALRDANIQGVTAVHRGPVPFRFARDGDTEGIKQESAVIADEILAGSWPGLTLVSTEDVGSLQRALLNADAVIYNIGFRTYLNFPVLDGSGLAVSSETIVARKFPDLFGFGIGFPSLYTAPNGKQYPDVGFAGFIDAIVGSLPLLV